MSAQPKCAKAKPVILPCPFCGTQPKFSFFKKAEGKPEVEGSWWALSCSNKSCRVYPTASGEQKADAIAAWNRRAPLPLGESNHRDAARRTLQPIVWDRREATGEPVVAFKPNRIVDFLLRQGVYDLNDLARMDFSDEDRAQFAQLIGYSVSGWGELSYVHLSDAHVADAIADELVAEAEAGKTLVAKQTAAQGPQRRWKGVRK